MTTRGSRRRGYRGDKRWIGWHSTSDEQRQVLRATERRERQAGRMEIRDQLDENMLEQRDLVHLYETWE